MTAPRPLPGPALPLGPAASTPPQAAGPNPTTTTALILDALLTAADHEQRPVRADQYRELARRLAQTDLYPETPVTADATTLDQPISVKFTKTAAAAGGYVGCIVAANWAVQRFGFVPVWFGVTATAGTYFAGLALGARDVLQDAAGRRAVLAAILLGAAVSWWISSPQLAAASAVAFTVSEAADFAVYTPLRRRTWAGAVLASNTVGAVIDSTVFLTLAGFGLAPLVGQLIGKILWATIVPVAVVTAFRVVKNRRGRCSS